jgi:hypothetical protein
VRVVATFCECAAAAATVPWMGEGSLTKLLFVVWKGSPHTPTHITWLMFSGCKCGLHRAVDCSIVAVRVSCCTPQAAAYCTCYAACRAAGWLASKVDAACYKELGTARANNGRKTLRTMIYVRTWAIRVALAEAVAACLVPEALLLMCNPVTCCWLQHVSMPMHIH